MGLNSPVRCVASGYFYTAYRKCRRCYSPCTYKHQDYPQSQPRPRRIPGWNKRDSTTELCSSFRSCYLTVILRGRAGYELIYITNEAVGRDGYYQLFSYLQNFSTRNSPSVFPYLVKLDDNGSYHGLREPIRKLENHYPELKIYKCL